MTITTATPGAATTAPGRPARDTGHRMQTVTAVLSIDCGDGRETGRGTFRYTRQPRAKYECLRCRSTEGPVTGPDAVRDFVARVRDVHRTKCTAPQEHA